MAVILASQSPRRRELLGRMGIDDFLVRPAQGEVAGEIMLFSVPRRGEKTAELSGPILREGLLRFTVSVTYYDEDGDVLLTWDGPVELW